MYPANAICSSSCPGIGSVSNYAVSSADVCVEHYLGYQVGNGESLAEAAWESRRRTNLFQSLLFFFFFILLMLSRSI